MSRYWSKSVLATMEQNRMDFHGSFAQNMELIDSTPRWYNQVSSFGKVWRTTHDGRSTHQQECLSLAMRMMVLPSLATILYVKSGTRRSASHAILVRNAFPNLT